MKKISLLLYLVNFMPLPTVAQENKYFAVINQSGSFSDISRETVVLNAYLLYHTKGKKIKFDKYPNFYILNHEKHNDVITKPVTTAQDLEKFLSATRDGRKLTKNSPKTGVMTEYTLGFNIRQKRGVFYDDPRRWDMHDNFTYCRLDDIKYNSIRFYNDSFFMKFTGCATSNDQPNERVFQTSLWTLCELKANGWPVGDLKKIFLNVAPNFCNREFLSSHDQLPEKSELKDLILSLNGLQEAKKYFSSTEFRYLSNTMYKDEYSFFDNIQKLIYSNLQELSSVSSDQTKAYLNNKIKKEPTYLPNLPHNLAKSFPGFENYIKQNSLEFILSTEANNYVFCMVGNDFVEFFPEYVKNNMKFATKYKECRFTEPKTITMSQLFMKGTEEFFRNNRKSSEINGIPSNDSKQVGTFKEFKSNSTLKLAGRVGHSVMGINRAENECPCERYELDTGDSHLKRYVNTVHKIYKDRESKWWIKQPIQLDDEKFDNYDDLLRRIYDKNYN